MTSNTEVTTGNPLLDLAIRLASVVSLLGIAAIFYQEVATTSATSPWPLFFALASVALLAISALVQKFRIQRAEAV